MLRAQASESFDLSSAEKESGGMTAWETYLARKKEKKKEKRKKQV